MDELEILAVATLTLVLLGAFEVFKHRRNLSRIPIRIHVAGTRGKSSVTRLLAAALNEAGKRTAAKTTGTLARMILPDGREVPIFRPSGANIIEQLRVISTTNRMRCDAIVIECMALIPELHWISESKMVRATHGVITNARADHLEVMGPQETDVARALAGIVPPKAKMFTAERQHLDIIEHACKDRETELFAVTEAEVEAIAKEDLLGFAYTEHAENVALALKILADLGIDRQTALRGMKKTRPDPGALTEHEVHFFGRTLSFINAFAANDPTSTQRIWNLSKQNHPEIDKTVAVFNLRADRPHRTIQLVRETSIFSDADDVVLMGSGAYTFARVAASAGIDASRIVYAEQERIEDVFEKIIGVCSDSHTLVVGMGNIGGQGLDLVRYFKNRSHPRVSQ